MQYRGRCRQATRARIGPTGSDVARVFLVELSCLGRWRWLRGRLLWPRKKGIETANLADWSITHFHDCCFGSFYSKSLLSSFLIIVTVCVFGVLRWSGNSDFILLHLLPPPSTESVLRSPPSLSGRHHPMYYYVERRTTLLSRDSERNGGPGVPVMILMIEANMDNHCHVVVSWSIPGFDMRRHSKWNKNQCNHWCKQDLTPLNRQH